MILTIIFLVLLLIVTGLSYLPHRYFDFGTFFGGSFVILFILGMFWTILSIAAPQDEIKRTQHTAAITSLRNTETVSGLFTLGSGFINSQEKYFYFVKNQQGGYHRESVNADEATIYQDEDKNPYIFWETIYFRSNSFYIPQFLAPTGDKHSAYDLHVPKNTIVEKYSVE